MHLTGTADMCDMSYGLSRALCSKQAVCCKRKLTQRRSEQSIIPSMCQSRCRSGGSQRCPALKRCFCCRRWPRSPRKWARTRCCARR